MRSFQLHVPSVVLGLAACAVLFVSMSQVAPQLGPPRVEYGPNPRDMVQIKEGTPYTVPAGTILVVTALGSTFLQASAGTPTQLLVNGQSEVMTLYQGCGGTESRSVVELPRGLTVPAGAVVSLDGGAGASDDARAWGYLSR